MRTLFTIAAALALMVSTTTISQAALVVGFNLGSETSSTVSSPIPGVGSIETTTTMTDVTTTSDFPGSSAGLVTRTSVEFVDLGVPPTTTLLSSSQTFNGSFASSTPLVLVAVGFNAISEADGSYELTLTTDAGTSLVETGTFSGVTQIIPTFSLAGEPSPVFSGSISLALTNAVVSEEDVLGDPATVLGHEGFAAISGVAVPEPSSFAALACIGLVGMGVRRRVRKA